MATPASRKPQLVILAIAAYDSSIDILDVAVGILVVTACDGEHSTFAIADSVLVAVTCITGGCSLIARGAR